MTKPSISLLLTALPYFFIACSGAPAEPVVTHSMDTVAKAAAFTTAMVDNKKDPSCGMPLTAGIGDTSHTAGKVLGFCSKECKDEFLKDTTAGLAKAGLK